MTTQSDIQALPLTRLSEDERLFRDSVYEFADREIRPLVREMDEQAKIPKALIEKLFDEPQTPAVLVDHSLAVERLDAFRKDDQADLVRRKYPSPERCNRLLVLVVLARPCLECGHRRRQRCAGMV